MEERIFRSPYIVIPAEAAQNLEIKTECYGKWLQGFTQGSNFTRFDPQVEASVMLYTWSTLILEDMCNFFFFLPQITVVILIK